MPLVYPAYCRKCDCITGHRRISRIAGRWNILAMKTECQKCHDVKPVPLKRWAAGTLFFIAAFGFAFYLLWASLSVLWPLFMMPFIDYETGEFTFGILMVPGYWTFAWIVGKVIK